MQHNDDSDSALESDCGLNPASAVAVDQHSQSAVDANVADSLDPVSLPVDVNQALVLSLDDILGEAESTLEQFNVLRLNADLFLGLDADADERIVHRFGMLVRKLSQLIDALGEAEGAAALGSLSSQSAEIRRDGIRLFLAIRRLQLLIEARDRCGLRNLGVLLSSIETIALELKAGHAGTVNDTFELHYFFFKGQLPNVVPPDGGWLYLVGSGLWQEGQLQVELTDPDSGTTVAALEAQQTGVDEIAAIKIEPDWIADNTGRCLYLNVSNNIVSGMLWWKQLEQVDYSTLPVCITQIFSTQYRIAGFLEYRTPTQTIPLKSRAILFENDSCIDRKQVSASLEWTMPPGGSLVAMGESPLYEAGDSSIECKTEENRITCSGHLGKAVCGQALSSGGKEDEDGMLLELTEWEHIFTPTARIPLEKIYYSHALSESVDFELPIKEVVVLVPREEPSEQTKIWYELIIVNGGQQKRIFASPGKNLLEMQQHTCMIGYDRIMADLDPASGSTDSEIRVRIDPGTCPY